MQERNGLQALFPLAASTEPLQLCCARNYMAASLFNPLPSDRQLPLHICTQQSACARLGPRPPRHVLASPLLHPRPQPYIALSNSLDGMHLG